MESFAAIIKGFKLLTIAVKFSILGVCVVLATRVVDLQSYLNILNLQKIVLWK